MPSLEEIDAGDTKHFPELIIGHFHGSWAVSLTGCRLREGCRTCGVKAHMTFHFLHGLVDVSIEYGDRAKSLEIGESLRAVVGSPSPFRIHRPQRDVCED